ncbi:unnamed protein product [Blepharisma stoltei]|uniref:MARVEL domain-containing protein n=1 Tax=Blepharisma stoltei TaxID=1481888 RepID=A0AAU9J2M0_9CILI|nr:unnamed protein product [Blepharisma stoltei]
MDLSSSVFNNYDIEVAKRSVKHDAGLFLTMYFLPVTLVIIVQSPPDLIFTAITWYFPYLISAILGFLASSNEMSYTNCYSCYLKCTLILVIINIIWAIIYFFAVLGNCKRNCEDPVVGSLIGLAYAGSVFALWVFANKHANIKKGPIFPGPRQDSNISN